MSNLRKSPSQQVDGNVERLVTKILSIYKNHYKPNQYLETKAVMNELINSGETISNETLQGYLRYLVAEGKLETPCKIAPLEIIKFSTESGSVYDLESGSHDITIARLEKI